MPPVSRGGSGAGLGARPDVFAKELAAESKTWRQVIGAAGLEAPSKI